MNSKIFALCGAAPCALLCALATPALAQADKPAPVSELVQKVDIPYEQFTLDNGLRVVVSTDRKAPVVALSIWYHIGSKDEPAGRTGFAHLFEHLMFGGSENSDQSWFQPMQAIGATDLNGTTSFDRTNYFETVPRGALETALFLESDRMGHLLGAVTQEKLDTQRGVVQNEKRGRDNQPGGLLEYEIQQTLYPKDSPYYHTPIGSMADLDHANLATVKSWFSEHYGPNNAVLVLAGDIDAATAKPLVEKYFGDIARVPATVHPTVPVPDLPAPVTKALHDRVANTTISRNWTIPGLTSDDSAALDMTASVLGGLSSSRLTTALVRQQKVAVSVSAGAQQVENGGTFSIDVVVKPGVDPESVGKQLDAIVADFLKNGPTPAELDRAKTASIGGTIRGLESVGGFGGKAVALATGAVYANDPGFYKKQLAREAALTPASVRSVANHWLSRTVFSYTLSPGDRGAYEEAATVKGTIATPAASEAAPAPVATRAKPPALGTIADLDFPEIQHAKLSNGIEVTFARRSAVPVVRVAVDFDAGNAADPKEELGTQSFMLSMLDEGTDRYTSLQIAELKENLGAAITAASNVDSTNVYLSALTPNLTPSLALMADIVRHPAFRAEEVERVRAQQLAGIAAEMKQPVALALRTLPPILFGKAHPYGVPFSGTGDPAIVATLKGTDLSAFHDAWLRPDNARIYVVGDTTLKHILPLLESTFGDWKATGAKPVKDFSVATPEAKGRILLLDQPASPQSLIIGGVLMPVQGTDDLVPLLAANDVLGGSFLSRLNMDLRETKHWAYGAQGIVLRDAHTVPYLVYAPVQADQTGPSIAAARSDIEDFIGPKGVTPEELKRTVDGSILELPGQFETSGAVLGALESNTRYHRPDNYYATLASRYRGLKAEELDAAAKAALDPSKMLWVVVGDAAKVKPQLDTLGLPVEVVGSPPAADAK